MNIAVYCSSSNHIPERYKAPAFQFGKWIAENGHTLVFGGATGGLMSEISEGASSVNGKITGIIPEAVLKMNRQNELCTELITVETMDQRKSKLKEAADLFVVLPGSYGTLDEMFDVIASGIVGEHKKPLIIINQDDYYDLLINQIEKMKKEKFIPVENYKPLFVRDINQAIKHIQKIK